MAFDDELGPLPTADVKSLAHYGEPYDVNTLCYELPFLWRPFVLDLARRACCMELTGCLQKGVSQRSSVSNI
jgi:hypothetical protein